MLDLLLDARRGASGRKVGHREKVMRARARPPARQWGSPPRLADALTPLGPGGAQVTHRLVTPRPTWEEQCAAHTLAQLWTRLQDSCGKPAARVTHLASTRSRHISPMPPPHLPR